MATTKSDLAARAAAVIPGGVNSGQRRVPGLEELVIAATSGATFTDGDGNTYTDYHAAFGPPLLGHGDPDVDAAVAATARSVGLMGVGVTEVEVELAERICELVPSAERVLLTETGSEATFHALRVARAATGRREVITGFRHALGGYQSIAGVTPDLTTLGKAMGNGWPVSALAGKAELMELFSTTPGRPAFFAGTFNGHPPTAAAALATVEKLQREPVHEHGFPLGARTRQGLRELYARLGVPVWVSGFGSVFVTYFLEGEPSSYDDLLANDVELFIGYRRELMKHGIFELPLNLKRSHFSYAHTDDDVDRLLEATEVAVSTVLAAR